VDDEVDVSFTDGVDGDDRSITNCCVEEAPGGATAVSVMTAVFEPNSLPVSNVYLRL